VTAPRGIEGASLKARLADGVFLSMPPRRVRGEQRHAAQQMHSRSLREQVFPRVYPLRYDTYWIKRR
jgi:hypothetical protein